MICKYGWNTTKIIYQGFYNSDKCKKFTLASFLYFGYKCKRQNDKLRSHNSFLNVKNSTKTGVIWFWYKCQKTVGVKRHLNSKYRHYIRNKRSQTGWFFDIRIRNKIQDFWHLSETDFREAAGRFYRNFRGTGRLFIWVFRWQ